MSKKFRKFSVVPPYEDHIKNAINLNVDRNEPIKLTISFGGYKLWRLDEFPETDWAELFSLIYYINWLTPICEIYKPGVWFDFFVDDFIVVRMNNLQLEDTDRYRKSFIKLIDFIDQYKPENLKFTYNRVFDRYKDEAEFEADLQDKIAKMELELGGKMPILNDEDQRAIELNVKLGEQQAKDPMWREKVHILHKAYLNISKKRPYYWAEDKILVGTGHFQRSIGVGTTKRSIAKFWCGVGVLEKNGESFNQLVLSPSQIGKSEIKKEKIKIKGLDGRNFEAIGISA